MAWPIIERHTHNLIDHPEQYFQLNLGSKALLPKIEILAKLQILWEYFQRIQEDLSHSRKILEQVQRVLPEWKKFEFQFNQQNELVFCHIHSEDSPFGCAALDVCRNEHGQFEFLIIMKKKLERKGTFKQTRAAINLLSFQRVAKIQNCSKGEHVLQEFEHLQQLQEVPVFPRVIYSCCYTYTKKHSLDTIRQAIFVSWIEMDLHHLLCRTAAKVAPFFTPKHACSFVKKILEDIALLHKRGILIRDLKIENIGVMKKGSDFIPIFFDAETMSLNIQSLQQPVCTVSLMPPESFSRQTNTTTFADMWCFGWVLAEIFYHENSDKRTLFLQRLMFLFAEMGKQEKKIEKLIAKVREQKEDHDVKQKAIRAIQVSLKTIFELSKQISIMPPQTALDHLLFQLFQVDPKKRFTACQALEFFQRYVEAEICEEDKDSEAFSSIKRTENQIEQNGMQSYRSRLHSV